MTSALLFPAVISPRHRRRGGGRPPRGGFQGVSTQACVTARGCCAEHSVSASLALPLELGGALPGTGLTGVTGSSRSPQGRGRGCGPQRGCSEGRVCATESLAHSASRGGVERKRNAGPRMQGGGAVPSRVRRVPWPRRPMASLRGALPRPRAVGVRLIRGSEGPSPQAWPTSTRARASLQSGEEAGARSLCRVWELGVPVGSWPRTRAWLPCRFAESPGAGGCSLGLTPAPGGP